MISEAEEILSFDEIIGMGGDIGLITLSRPAALNALTWQMCVDISAKLAEWDERGHIKAVVFRGEGDKAFCAGGDIRSIYNQGKSGAKRSCKFFESEYQLDHHIFYFSKPIIALMHGITMGGGAGLAVHCSHRVGAENLLFAMPETGIGFFPDAGGSYFLPRCTGNTGYYMGLTGAKLHIADALYAGIVDHLVPKENFAALIATLAETKFNENVNMQVSDIINSFSMDKDSMDIYNPHLLEHRAEINQCFGFYSIEKILAALQRANSEWCQLIFTQLSEKSPTSLKVALKQLLLGAQMNFNECLQMEYRIAQRFLTHPDFYEGIRSAIIDKDRSPTWRPNDLSSLKKETIEAFFAPLEHELTFEKTPHWA